MKFWALHKERKVRKTEWLKVISFCNSIQFDDIYFIRHIFHDYGYKAELTITLIKLYVEKQRKVQKRAEYRRHRKAKPTFNVEIVPYNLKESDEDELN